MRSTFQNATATIFASAWLLSALAGAETLPLRQAAVSDAEQRFDFQTENAVSNGAIQLSSPGSLVFNFDGLADSFRAYFSTRSDVVVQIDFIVDRKIARSITVKPGEAPVPESIDLRGAEQLEISAQSGPPAKARSIELSRAEFEVKDRAEFQRRLIAWRHRMAQLRQTAAESPVMPPEWKSVDYQSIKRGDFTCYRIDNGKLTVEIAPGFGGRIVGFGRSRGRNVLKAPPEFAVQSLRRGEAVYRQHSRFARSEPDWYFLPGEDLHAFGPYEISFGPDEGEVKMVSRPSYYLWLRSEYRLKLAPGADRLELETRLVNLGKFSRPCGVWSIAAIDAAAVKRVTLPAESGDAVSPPKTAALWQISDGKAAIDEPGRAADRNGNFERRGRGIGTGIMAEMRNGDRFCIRPAGNVSALYPVHFFANKDFVELELHSGVVELPPGGAVSLLEYWRFE